MLYRQIGDAPAFGLVMDHFDVLREAIVAEEGAIVKTIGDSVMAAFREPAAALRAGVSRPAPAWPNRRAPWPSKPGFILGLASPSVSMIAWITSAPL